LFDTSTVTMRATSGKVLTDAEQIRTDLTALGNRLAALQGQWIGDGRTAFQGAEARYQAANTRLNQALTEIGSLIASNEARYTADDASAQAGLSGAGAAFDAPGF
jgi:WXG100 family type VII secretion target